MSGTGRALAGLAVGAGLAFAGGAAAGGIDRGSDRPPGSVPTPTGRLGLTPDGKAIWMTEWGACWRLTLTQISKELGVPIHAGVSPQQAARRLATRAVFLLYETTPETLAAKDGCRNGILWRYYHPG